MLHSNAGELHQLFATFTRVWGEGGGASLSLETVDGKVSAVLKLQLGPPSAPRPGAPEALHQAAGCPDQQPGKQRRRRHRGPGRQKRDAARREAWKRRRQEAQPSPPELVQPPPPPPPPPPTPTAPTARLIKVVERKASSWPTFSQLDGEGGSVEESQSEVRQVDASSSASSSPPSPAFKSTYCWACLDPHPMARAPPDCPYLTGRRLPWQLQK